MWEKEVSHDGLNKYKIVKGRTEYEAEQKAYALMRQWDEMWGRKLAAEKRRMERENATKEKGRKKLQAIEKTDEVQNKFKEIETTLKFGLENDCVIDWDSLVDNSDYPIKRPEKPKFVPMPTEPKKSDSGFVPRMNFAISLIPRLKEKRIKEAGDLFRLEHSKWRKEKQKTEQNNEKLKEEYERDLHRWEKERQDYIKKRDENNENILKRKEKYFKKEPDVIVYYCELVLHNSKYPETFPKEFRLEYNPASKILLVDYFLPSKENIPTLEEVKYNASRDEFKEKHISEQALNGLYDNLLYQITLRCIYELYQSDVIEAITSIVFNGYVRFKDKGTGKEVSPCILSIQTKRDEILEINLADVDPKLCFKRLKGVGSSKLHGLAPIAPIMELSREDKRFIAHYDMAESLDETTIYTAMDWKDFENLIREIFEKEFVTVGGEVKITRASRDEGVDAIAFDPDPIRGGKIVIQAKRYTNTVGVSAVRDLYGTVVNEGAIKGILVTTSDYGPDAYKFARDKPITLLNGNNLFHLLDKYGHRAKIDINEAKKILAEREGKNTV